MTHLLAAAQDAHASSGGGSLIGFLVFGAVIFAAGMHFGRRRGLRHLGEVEFRNRWANVRSHSRW